MTGRYCPPRGRLGNGQRPQHAARRRSDDGRCLPPQRLPHRPFRQVAPRHAIIPTGRSTAGSTNGSATATAAPVARPTTGATTASTTTTSTTAVGEQAPSRLRVRCVLRCGHAVHPREQAAAVFHLSRPVQPAQPVQRSRSAMGRAVPRQSPTTSVFLCDDRPH